MTPKPSDSSELASSRTLTQFAHPLSLEEFQKFHRLKPGDEGENWGAVEQLVNHLDDELVVVDHIDLGDALAGIHASATIASNWPPSRLAVCTARNATNTKLYVSATRGGVIVIGAVDALRVYTVRNLDEFNPIQHEVMSLVISGRHRPLTDALDLWVVVRELPCIADGHPRTVAYHGLISLDATGKPQLRPALDDFETRDEKRWLPQPADKLPRHIRQWNLSFSASVDPFTPLPKRAVSCAEDALAETSCRGEDVAVVAWTAKAIWFAASDRIVLVHRDNAEWRTEMLEMQQAVSMSVIDRKPQRRAIVACVDQTLVALGMEKNGNIERLWSQRRHGFPVGVVFLPDDSSPSSKDAWPDALALFSDGRLERLRYVGNRALREAWNDCWKRLGTKGPSCRIAVAGRQAHITPLRTKATLLGAVESLLAESMGASSAQRSQWLREFSELFHGLRAREGQSKAVAVLVRALRDLRQEEPQLRPLPDGGGDFLLALLDRIHAESAIPSIRHRIDRAIQGADWPDQLRDDPNLISIRQRQQSSRRELWSNDTAAPKEPSAARVRVSLERWANTYLMSDSEDLGSHGYCADLGRVAWCEFRHSDEEHHPWLLVGRDGTLSARAVDGCGELKPKALHLHWLKGRRVHRVLRAPGSEDGRLLIVSRTGHISLVKAQSESHEPLKVLGEGTCVGDGPVTGVAACGLGLRGGARSTFDAEGVVAVVRSSQLVSTLALYLLSRDGIRLLQEQMLPVSQVRAIDIARGPDSGYWLLAVTDRPGPVCAFRISEGGGIQADIGTRFLWTLKSGAGAARLSDHNGSRLAAIGGHDGIVWCGPLVKDKGIHLPNWTCQLRGSVRTIEEVTLDGRPHFAVGTASGDIDLISGLDGRRVWTHRLEEPISDLAVSRSTDNQRIAVLTTGGSLTVFCRPSNQETKFGWSAVDRELERLKVLRTGHSPTSEHDPNEDLVAGLLTLREDKQSAPAVLEACQSRTSRALVIRCLAETRDQSLDAIRGVLTHLEDRELLLLLYHLPDDFSDWDRIIQERMEASESLPQDGFEGSAAILLERLGRRKPGVAMLMQQAPQPHHFSSRWVRIEFARLLIKAAVEEMQQQAKVTRVRVLPSVMLHLLQSPTSVVTACASVLPHGSSDKGDLDALSAGLDWLYSPDERMSPKILARLSESLQPVESVKEWPRLLSAVVDLHYCFQENSAAAWEDWRSSALDSLRAVTTTLDRFYPMARPPADILADGLRQMLPPTPIPDDTGLLEDRERWVEAASRLVEKHPAAERRQDLWGRPAARLLEKTHLVLRALLRSELTYLLSILRPRLELLGCERGEGNHVSLRLKASPEGARELRDVSIDFDAGGDGGLRPPGRVCERISATTYSAASDPSEFQLDGFVRPGENRVSVRVTITDESGRELEESWPLDLPEREQLMSAQLTIPERMPATFAAFEEAVVGHDEMVVIAVLDEDLGRERFLKNWDSRFSNCRLDLDEAVCDTGVKRRYSARRLDLGLLKEAVERGMAAAQQAIERDGSVAEQPMPFMIGPLDEVVRRAEGGEAPNLVKEAGAALQEYRRANSAQFKLPQLVLLVSSVTAAELRRELGGVFPEVAAHRLPLKSIGEDSKDSRLWKEMVTLVGSESHVSDTRAREVVDRFGGDRRLLIRWLRSIRAAGGQEEESPDSFLQTEPSTSLLRAELSALRGLDLIVAIASARATTRLPLPAAKPGHFSSGEVESTTRTSPRKLIQRGGNRVTEGSLYRIRSDRARRAHLEVQGFGTEGTAKASGTKLLEAAVVRSKSDRAASFSRLASLGIGEWREPIFRTATPFRVFINRIYSEKASSATIDAEAYADIVGEDRSPSEVVTADDLRDLATESLLRLMPNTKRMHLKALRRLAAVWKDPDSDDIEQVLRSVFSPERVIPISRDTTRWDEPLASLGLPIFAVGVRQVGGTSDDYPAAYLLWLEGDAPFSVGRVSAAVDSSTDRWREREVVEECDEFGGRKEWVPPVFLLGPGVEVLEEDPARKTAILRLSDAIRAAWEGDLAGGLRRRARAQLRLTTFSPFQASGSLPPGSLLFVGREEEISFIRQRVRNVSVLIVGCRRVGKTSLLNQISYWASQEPDLEPVLLDLQGVRDREGFLSALRFEMDQGRLRGMGCEEGQAGVERRDVRAALRGLATEIDKKGKLALFLFNEIDGLAEHEPSVIELWRGMNDEGLARFVMVGYSVIGGLAAAKAPLFHFTEGTSFGGKAIALTELSSDAARRLLDLLESGDLQLSWRTPEEREQAYDLILKRSYRIPWVLQRYAQLLVERLEEERRSAVTFEDVELLLGGGGGERGVVWQFMQSIDYGALGLDRADIQNPGLRLVLSCLARDRYFLGGESAPIRDPRLADRSPVDLGFSVGDARAVVQETIDDLLLDEQRTLVRSWFDRVDLRKALNLLTLTLTLEPDPREDDRFAFLLHIVPLELQERYGRDDPMLDTLIINQTIEFTNVMAM